MAPLLFALLTGRCAAGGPLRRGGNLTKCPFLSVACADCAEPRPCGGSCQKHIFMSMT